MKITFESDMHIRNFVQLLHIFGNGDHNYFELLSSLQFGIFHTESSYSWRNSLLLSLEVISNFPVV